MTSLFTNNSNRNLVTMGDLRPGDFVSLTPNCTPNVRLVRSEPHGTGAVWLTWESNGRLRRASFPVDNMAVRA